jgi:hypothetical protein
VGSRADLTRWVGGVSGVESKRDRTVLALSQSHLQRVGLDADSATQLRMMSQQVLLVATQKEHDNNLEVENQQPDWGDVGKIRGLGWWVDGLTVAFDLSILKKFHGGGLTRWWYSVSHPSTAATLSTEL